MTFSSGQIFVYDYNPSQLSIYHDFFNSRSLEMFGTDNIYKLVQYAKEVAPEIMIFNLSDNPQQTILALEHISKNEKINYPVIILNPYNMPFTPPRQTAHYLTAPIDVKKFVDIVESYCLGFKKHQILLLDSISDKPNFLRNQLDKRNYSYFEVHNGEAANRYLQKNQPQIVCVEYAIPFIVARHNLNHDKIFYVDRQQDIDEIEQFLN